MRVAYLSLALLTACSSSPPALDAAPLVPLQDWTRDILSTGLTVDLTSKTATASITLAASESLGASFEIGDLTIDSVTDNGVALPHNVVAAASGNGNEIDLGVPSTGADATIDFSYHFNYHDDQDGADDHGYTLLWPYYCGNLFPCKSTPVDGTTFTLALSGVPDGQTAIFPTSIPADAPSYQIAWSIDAYVQTELGTTTAGTKVSVFNRAADAAHAMAGTAHLVAAFDWFEKTLGPYRFGNDVGTVSVHWNGGAYGGMEHHPYWHVGSDSLSDEDTNVHESAHGWFGDGIRIGCWEDFVLSEGTVSYLAGRALDVVAPTVGAAAWNEYASELAGISPTDPVWPTGCNQIDILKDNLFTDAPYMRGAFFYRAVALKIGAEQLDSALAAYYAAHAGGTGTMDDMLTTIKSVTGFDPTTCANMWMRSTTIPAIGACPS